MEQEIVAPHAISVSVGLSATPSKVVLKLQTFIHVGGSQTHAQPGSERNYGGRWTSNCSFPSTSLRLALRSGRTCNLRSDWQFTPGLKRKTILLFCAGAIKENAEKLHFSNAMHTQGLNRLRKKSE